MSSLTMRPFLKERAGVGSKKKREVARHKLLLVLVHWPLLVGYMASEKNVVVKAPIEVFLQSSTHFCADSAPGVPDELPLGHLVLHVGRAQVHREQDQGEAHHVYRVHRHRQGGVTLAEPDRELFKKPL